MSKLTDLWWKFVWVVLVAGFLSALVGAMVLPICCHKDSLERMVGHRVSWWDAYWTN
jgi:hypothetical protein